MPSLVPPADALRTAAELGPYFTWEPWTAGGGWRPFKWPDHELVEAARRGLGDVEPRVAASITFLGAASRLVSPPLGALILTGVLPSARLWWRPHAASAAGRQGGASWQIGYDRAEPAADIVTTVIDGPVAPMLAAFRDRYAVSPKVLWGNVASAVAGATGLLADLRPECAARAAEVTAGLLDRAPLAGTGTLIRPDPASARAYLIRRSCCLYYRVPGGGLCGDCVLNRRSNKRPDTQVQQGT